MAKKNAAIEVDAETVTESTDTDSTAEAQTIETPDAPPAAPPVDASEERDRAEDLDTDLDKDPGKALGIVALIASIVAAIVGVGLGLLAYRKSRAAGFGGGLGIAAMIIGTVSTALIALYLVLMAGGMGLGGACEGREPGVYTLDNGTMITCQP